MARGQGAARHRRPGPALSGTPPPPPRVARRVHDLAEARRALAEDPGALLVTAPDSAAFAGAGFWRAVEAALGRAVVVDCGDDAGLALAALREGLRDLLFTGAAPIAEKLASIAGQSGARLRRDLDEA